MKKIELALFRVNNDNDYAAEFAEDVLQRLSERNITLHKLEHMGQVTVLLRDHVVENLMERD